MKSHTFPEVEELSKDERIKNILKSVQHWQLVSFYLVAYDVIAVTLSYFMALLIRFDFRFSMIPAVYFKSWAYFAPIYAVLAIMVFWRLRLYNSIWRFASFKELERVTLATIVTTIIHVIGVTIMISIVARDLGYTASRMTLSYYTMGAMIQFLLITGVRFSYRYILLLRSSREKKSASKIALIGMHSIIGTT